MYIQISSFGRTTHLLPLAAFQRALAAGEVVAVRNSDWDESSAHRFLRQHFCGENEISRLRAALVHEVYDVTRMQDEDVFAAAARLLHGGAWRTGHAAAPRTAAATAPTAATAPAATARRSSASPARQAAPAPVRTQSSPPVRSTPAPAPDAATPALRAPEWSEDTDQLAFAEVLEQAARGGTPFCAICEAMRNNPSAIPA